LLSFAFHGGRRHIDEVRLILHGPLENIQIDPRAFILLSVTVDYVDDKRNNVTSFKALARLSKLKEVLFFKEETTSVSVGIGLRDLRHGAAFVGFATLPVFKKNVTAATALQENRNKRTETMELVFFNDPNRECYRE